MMMLILCALFYVVTIPCVHGLNIIDSLATTYSSVLKHLTNDGGIDVESVNLLLKLHDDDAVCGKECLLFIESDYLKQVRDHHPRQKAYDFIYSLIDTIYGEEISLDPYQPQEIHLSLTNENHVMKVMFVTMESLQNPFVEYKLEKNSDWRKSDAVQYTYTVEQKWWPIFTGVIYEANMDGLLLPSTSYQYRVGGFDSANNTIRYSEEYVFQTPPINTRPDQTVKIAILADHGTFELLGFDTVNHMHNQSDSFDIIHIVGDIAYAGLSSAIPALNISKEDEFSHIWDLYGIQNQKLTAVKPFMVTNGNHERFYDWAAYTNRYKMPASAQSNGNFWYSYNYGNIHMVSISSEHDLSADSPQIAFLINDLQQAVENRENVPWIVLNIHKPVYSTIEGAPSFRDYIEQYLLEYDVDLVLFGHMHAYERISPVNNYVLTVPPAQLHHADAYYSTGKGPVYVCQGNTGAMQGEKFVQPQPDWSAVRMANGIHPRNKSEVASDDVYSYRNTFGYGVITSFNSTHLFYENIPNTEKIRFTDRFWIVKRV